MHGNWYNQNAWLFIIKKTNCSRLQIFHVRTNAYNQFQLPFASVRVSFFSSFISILLAKKREWDYFDLFTNIKRNDDSFWKKISMRTRLFSQKWRKNKLQKICWFIVSRGGAKNSRPRRKSGIGKLLVIRIIQIFRLNFPCFPPPVFLRSLRQLKFVVSYPRFREIKFLTRRFWKSVTFEERRETYRSFPAKYNFSLVF